MSELKNFDVVILCGGQGKRLRSQVGETQKTMAAVNGQPFLNILLKYLKEEGFARVVLCTGFDAARIEDY